MRSGLCSCLALTAMGLLFAACGGDRQSTSGSRPSAGDALTGPTRSPGAHAPAVDSTIQNIERSLNDVVRRRSTLREVKRDLDEYSVEGGELAAYFEGDALRLADVTLFGESGQVDYRFMYDAGGRLQFAELTESRYDRPFGDVQTRESTRFYFDRGELMKLRNERGDVPLDGGVQAEAKDLLEFTSRIRDEARRP